MKESLSLIKQKRAIHIAIRIVGRAITIEKAIKRKTIFKNVAKDIKSNKLIESNTERLNNSIAILEQWANFYVQQKLL